MGPSFIEVSASIIFLFAVIHTFFVNKFADIAHKYPEGSVRENFFHFLAEIEAVFGIWSAIFLIIYSLSENFQAPVKYLESLNFTEPAFVFVIMAIAGTRPVVKLSELLIIKSSFLLRFLPAKMSFYIAVTIIGPLLGSFITEPAAMTVTALILLKYFFSKEMSTKFKYATIGLLFVNVSIGGTLSHFAAPPVLMVAGKWGWGLEHMLINFGYKGAISCIISSLLTAFYFRKELKGKFHEEKEDNKLLPIPYWVTFIHLLFLSFVVLTAHHMVVFLGLFLFFLGFTIVTKEFQEPVKIKEPLMVGFFLGGLIVLGTLQKWWLQPLLLELSDNVLFFGTTVLTAITDNAALTYLGSLVELSESAKYLLLAGAVSGGGLTVIANAPNPAGYGILKSSFPKSSISPLGILCGALLPTVMALICFGLLP